MPQQQNAASNRLDQQLQDLIQGQHWKQALSLCEKRMKKGDKSDKLLVYKANILLLCPDQTRLQQGRRELDALLDRDVPITDVEALLTLEYEGCRRNDKDPRMEKAWERATTARPQDERLHLVWCELKFQRTHWKSAQKASMKYMKNFPKKQDPFFWTILSSFLAGALADISEDDRRILWPLAYRLLSKAAADVPAGNEMISPGRSLHTLEDLFLLLKVYQAQDKNEEALAVLEDSRTGIHSRIGKNSWELVRTKIELYEVCNLWRDEWQYCWELLEDARPDHLQDGSRAPYSSFGKVGDDWKVWAGLVDATCRLGTQEHRAGLEIMLEDYLKQDTVSRNARLALLRWHSQLVKQDKDCQDKFLSVCSEYFSDHCSRVVCFRDLHPYLKHLERSKQEELCRLAANTARGNMARANESEPASVSWITSEINALKLDYHLVVSQDDNIGGTDLLRAFVSNCLRLYKLSLPLGSNLPVSERRPGDDAAILAVMALMHLHKHGEFNALLRAAVALDFLLSHSKHNYDALLILVRLYLFLGAGSLAVRTYLVLSIKNIQIATLSWILFTRISTTHPYLFSPATKAKNGASASFLLSTALDWHLSAANLSDAATGQMLQGRQWCTMLENIATQNSVQQGFCNWLATVESLRIERLAGPSGTGQSQLFINDSPDRIRDNRDRSAFPDCEATGQLRFDRYLCLGPEPNSKWIGIQLHMARLWDLLHFRPSAIPILRLQDLEDNTEPDENTVTPAESAARELIFISIERLWCISIGRVAANQRDAADKETRGQLQNIESWLSSASTSFDNQIANTFPLAKDLKIPTWHYFHEIHVLLDVCRFTHALTDLIDANIAKMDVVDKDIVKASCNRIRALVGNCFSNAHQSASKVQGKMKQNIAANEVIKAGIGQADDYEDSIGVELRNLIGVSCMENFGATLRESWVEALTGVTQIKAP